jgi:hypothetical protein
VPAGRGDRLVWRFRRQVSQKIHLARNLESKCQYPIVESSFVAINIEVSCIHAGGFDRAVISTKPHV